MKLTARNMRVPPIANDATFPTLDKTSPEQLTRKISNEYQTKEMPTKTKSNHFIKDSKKLTLLQLLPKLSA